MLVLIKFKEMGNFYLVATIPPFDLIFICVKRLFVQSNNGGGESKLYNVSMHHVRRWNVLWMFFPPSCLSWNIFIPNKPVFTLDVAQGCHSFPDTLLKVRLNSLLINKWICGFSLRFTTALIVILPARLRTAKNGKYLQQLPEWRLARGWSCTQTRTSSEQGCFYTGKSELLLAAGAFISQFSKHD